MISDYPIIKKIAWASGTRRTGASMNTMHGIEYVGYIDPWTDEERLTDEEVVRCGDCKNHVDTPKRGCRCYRWMTLDCYENPVPSEVEPDGFCSWGERRDA